MTQGLSSHDYHTRTLEVNYARRAVTATQMYMFYIKPVIGVPEIGFSHTTLHYILPYILHYISPYILR